MNYKPNFTALRIVHAAMWLGMMLFLAVTVFLNKDGAHFEIMEGNHPEIYLAILMGVASLIGSNFMYLRKLSEIDLYTGVDEKFPQYFNACIIRYGLINVGAVFNVVIWFFTDNLITVGISAVLVFYLIILWPTRARVTAVLRIEPPDTLK